MNLTEIKSQLRIYYKNYYDKYPAIAAAIRRCYYKKPFNSVSRKIKGKRNVISYRHSILSSVKFTIEGNDNSIEIEGDCLLTKVHFKLSGNGHRILIKSGCRFYHGSVIWIEDYNCSLTIGRNSTFEDVHFAITEPCSKIKIGDDCMFAYDIDLQTGDSHSIISTEDNKRINPAKDITIGKHVWVATHASLLKGANISDHSIIATGSVVTRGFEDRGIIIGGNPAKKIKENVTWSRQRV